MECRGLDGQITWRISGIYGHLESHNKHKTWEMMCDLNYTAAPWLCCRDFNGVVGYHEKQGGDQRCSDEINGFCNAIDACCL